MSETSLPTGTPITPLTKEEREAIQSEARHLIAMSNEAVTLLASSYRNTLARYEATVQALESCLSVPPGEDVTTALREENEKLYKEAVRSVRLLTEDFVRMSGRRDKAEAERDEARAFANRWMKAAMYATPVNPALAFDPTNPEAFAESRRAAVDLIMAESLRVTQLEKQLAASSSSSLPTDATPPCIACGTPMTTVYSCETPGCGAQGALVESQGVSPSVLPACAAGQSSLGEGTDTKRMNFLAESSSRRLVQDWLTFGTSDFRRAVDYAMKDAAARSSHPQHSSSETEKR